MEPTRSDQDQLKALLSLDDATRLLAAMRALAALSDLAGVMKIIRVHARELSGADGVTFVLRDGDLCFYAEENAIAPLWKGHRFQARHCVSGWCMQHREPLAILDIYADERVPADAYRPTFVKSLAMVPVRRADPIGAIGAYWATPHLATPRELAILQTLADAAAVAIANGELYARALRAEERFRVLADGMPQLVWTAIADGSLEYGNRRWCEVTGVPAAAGHQWYEAMWAEDRAPAAAAWRDALATGEPFEHSGRACDARDGARWMIARAVPLRDAEGHVTRWVGTCTDIHEQKLAEQEMARAVQLRDTFLTLASHELRTPLAALQLQLDGLLGLSVSAPDFSMQRTARLRKAVGYTARLTRLVSHLLDVSRIVSGRLPVEVTPFDLGALVTEIAAELASGASGTRSPIEVRVEPVEGRWDRDRIGQVVFNLLSNALRYGDGKPIAVGVRRDGDTAVLTVADQGIGIAPEHHRDIFERFHRAVSTHNYGGLGIGLWIAAEIVRRHGGAISVDSAPGRGATFHVRLPLAAAADEAALASA